jgi:hypothetical protein
MVLFLCVLGKSAILNGELVLAVALLFLFLTLLVVYFFVKEPWLYEDRCVLKRSFLRPDTSIPYGKIEKARMLRMYFVRVPLLSCTIRV